MGFRKFGLTPYTHATREQRQDAYGSRLKYTHHLLTFNGILVQHFVKNPLYSWSFIHYYYYYHLLSSLIKIISNYCYKKRFNWKKWYTFLIKFNFLNISPWQINHIFQQDRQNKFVIMKYIFSSTIYYSEGYQKLFQFKMYTNRGILWLQS